MVLPYLSQEPIAGYLPVTQVTDQAAIDLDQQKIEERVFVGEFAKARNVYTDGGHSFSFAELTLTAPVANKTFPKGTKVYGMNERSQNISGTLLDDVEWGVVGSEGVLVRVLYDTSDEQASYVDCQVGGLFTFMQANREGCKYAHCFSLHQRLIQRIVLTRYTYSHYCFFRLCWVRSSPTCTIERSQQY